MNRREAISRLASTAAATWCGSGFAMPALLQGDATPKLAAGAPNSAVRLALIESFKTRSAAVAARFEKRSHKGVFAMPYRLFRPASAGKLPLVVYLHGSGGQGNDNEKQMGLGNVFGTRVWALPENQKTFPAYVLAPQTDRGWMRYEDPAPGDSVARLVPGLGDGARAVFEIIDALRRELPIDDRRIYVTGQSMGGGGAWHMIAHRPRMFAGAVICCGSATREPATDSLGTPIWNFHGTADSSVPLTVSRTRIAALRKAGGHPLSTEYADVGHNSWEWAYTEPALVPWLFAHRRDP
jgi:predicted peptidase